MWGSLLIGVFILLLIWDYFYKKHRNEILKKSKVGGGISLPLIGRALHMVGANSQNAIQRIRQFTDENGKMFHAWIFHQLVIFCADPKILESLLSSPVHIDKNYVYDMLSAWLGNGLLLSTGKKWHTRRKIITPSFHFKILEEFVEIFEHQTNVMITKLQTFVDNNKNEPINMFPIVCLTALDIIAETAMGVQVNAQSNSDIGYVKSVKVLFDLKNNTAGSLLSDKTNGVLFSGLNVAFILPFAFRMCLTKCVGNILYQKRKRHNVTEIISSRLRKPLWRTDALFKIFAPHIYYKLNKHINLMQNFTKDVIEKRRLALENMLKMSSNQEDLKDDTEDDFLGHKKRMALLDLLLQASVDGKPLTNEDIREEVETFMFEGHDTTTSGTSFALYVISRHPEVQEKLLNEIREVIGDDKEQKVSYRQLQDLRYLECVIKESMRLYPPVPIIDGFIVPGNCHFNVPLFVVLRDADYFPEPNDFKPERFLDHAEDISPYAYTPFSAGPRNCIGQKYAMLEMKSVISKILRHFELLPLGPDVIPVLDLILRSKTGTHVGLKPRVYNK